MPDIPKPTGDVLRRNPERECGTPVGQVSVLIHNREGHKEMQTISFYCNKPRLHIDECEFVGAGVVIRKRIRT